jgi:hypothetical protein
VVDVEQQRVPPVGRGVRRRPAGTDGGEEVGGDERAARVVHERAGQRQQAALVPRDDGRQCLDDVHGAHPLVLQRGGRRAPEPQAADDDVEPVARQRRQPQPGQLDLGHGEQARHQVLVAEQHLVHLDAGDGLAAPSQRDLAERGGLEVQLLEAPRHGCSLAGSGRRERGTSAS